MLKSIAKVQRENALGVLRDMGWKVYLPWNWKTYLYLKHVVKKCDEALSS